MPKTFTGGIHPPDCKELAKDKSIERLPAPPELIVYLSQHIGARNGDFGAVEQVGF